MLECVPNELAKVITKELSIPTIGIGAGSDTDGQVIVLQDMLGAFDKNAKFVRRYANLNNTIAEKVNHFHNDIQCGEYPNIDESYT